MQRSLNNGAGRLRAAMRWMTVVALALLLGGRRPVFAALLSDSQMYLDPRAVPDAQYPAVDLAFNWNGSQLSDNSYTWPQSDVTGVQVLPLLNPYTSDDPAGYPSAYTFSQSDYFYEPNTDYQVDLTAGTAQATFYKPGVFHVQLDTSGGSTTYVIFVGSGMLDELGKSSTGASVKIDGPKADLVIVSNPTGGDSTCDKGAANATDDNGADKVKRASSMADAVARIKAASEAAGKKLHVELVAHGAPGVLAMGDTIIGGAGGPSIADFQAAIDDYVNNLSIYACSFAQGAQGMQALQTLADSIGRASGFTVPVSVHRGWLGSLVGGSWDLSLGGKNLSIPEPTSGLVLALLLMGLVRRQRCGR